MSLQTKYGTRKQCEHALIFAQFCPVYVGFGVLPNPVLTEVLTTVKINMGKTCQP